MIGALGALMFTAAATLTRLAPQFATGMIASGRPMQRAAGRGRHPWGRGAADRGVRRRAGRRGAVVHPARPTRPTSTPVTYAPSWPCSPSPSLIVYAALGLIDVARVPQILQLVVHLAVAAIALLALRVGLHLALLHEAHDEIHSDEPMLCPHCDHVVPDMAFCPACGVATQARPRDRRARRGARRRPVLSTEPSPTDVTTTSRATPYSAGTYTATGTRRDLAPQLRRDLGRRHRRGRRRPGRAVGDRRRSRRPATSARPTAGSPPTGEPVDDQSPLHRAPTAPSRCPIRPPARRTRSPQAADGVHGRSPRRRRRHHAVVQPARRRAAPRSRSPPPSSRRPSPTPRPPTRSPTRWSATSPGYGLVADCWPQGATASYSRMRVIVMVAVKNDLALIAGAVGPYHAVRPGLRARASRPAPTSSSPSTWASTSTASAGAATRRADRRRD